MSTGSIKLSASGWSRGKAACSAAPTPEAAREALAHCQADNPEGPPGRPAASRASDERGRYFPCGKIACIFCARSTLPVTLSCPFMKAMAPLSSPLAIFT